MTRPQPSEFHPFYTGYVQNVPEGDFLQVLQQNALDVKSFFTSIDKEKHDYRYEPGKWSIKQIVVHMSDTERVMSYRALTIARGDVNATLSQMDENLYTSHANMNGRTMDDLMHELMAVREATIMLYRYMTDGQSILAGNVLGHIITPRALGYIIVGHAMHHINVVSKKYL